MPFFATDYGGENHETCAIVVAKDVVDDLGRVLRGNGMSTDFACFFVFMPTTRMACSSEEESKVVVNFGCGCDGRARVVGGGALFDGDGWREAFNGFDIGLLKLIEKLTRIGGKRLHVLALAFCVDGVECERRFAGA